MENSVSIIFNGRPKRWGLRGDPYLWDELMHLFRAIPLPCSEIMFMQHFAEFFQEITNHPYTNESNVFVEEFSHGGMSSGVISMKFWQEIALPLLMTNLHHVNKEF